MKLFLIIALGLIMFCAPAQTNAQKCNGQLRSLQDDSPIAGATISLLKAGTKTVSQSDGTFSIACNGTDSILVMHAGYATYYAAVGSKNPLPATLRLQPLAKQMDEVQVNSVNTGYQAIPKERATGSFEKINNKLFNQQVGYTVLERLETIANGLYIDKKTNTATPRFAVRGLSSIQGPTAPLIILDNFPYEGDLANINPNDVESITLLKDAAAASIWGARAGNGVIVITTKKARMGQPLRIELNNSINLAEKPNLYYYDNISSSDLIDAEIFLYGRGFFTSQINSNTKPVLSPVVELLIKKANGSLSPAEADARINAMCSQDIRNDYDRYMYRPAVNMQHAITLRTGSNNSSHLFSAGYDRNIGSLNEKAMRISIRTENSFRINDRLQVTAAITFTQNNTNAGRIGYNSLSAGPGNLPMYTQLADEGGNPLAVMMVYRQSYKDTVGGGKLLNWNYYALDDHNHIQNNNRLQSLVGNIGISYKLIKGLTADIKYQYENQLADNSTVYTLGSYMARNLVNLYSQLNYTTGVVTYKVPKAGIRSSSNSILAAHNLRGQLNFSRQWKSHEVNAIAGAELRQITTDGSSNRTYGYNGDILSVAPMDFINPYPTFVTGSTSLIPNEQNFTGKLNRYISFYGNAAYTYRSRYTLSISGRRDASNLFGVRTNDKWAPLWSAGLGWDISKEQFYNFKKLPYLRLRATWGYSGNVDPGRSGVSVLTYANTNPNTQQPMAALSQFNNPDLRWEKMGILNIGIDFKVAGNRLSGSLEYYHKNSKDLLGFTATDYTAVPAFRLLKNVASMKANGWDISLNSINIKKPFSWETNLNFNINKDKVTDYLITNRSAVNHVSGGLSISAMIGKPVYALFVYPWAGLDPQTGDPMGFLNGKPSNDYNTLLGSAYPIDSLKYIGPTMPKLFGSLGNSFSYKGISLTVRLSWKLGYYFLRNSINYSNLFGSRQGHGDYALRWQKPGDEQFTNVPSLVYPAVSRRDQFYNNSEVLVQKADHIRLQYITLNYDIKSLLKRLPVKNLDFYININNLGLLWRANKYGIDPDYRDNTILPSKNYAIGLRTTL